MGEFLGCMLGLGIIVLSTIGVMSFRNPNEHDVVSHLAKLGHVKQLIEKDEIKHILISEDYRPLLMEWDGMGIRLEGNVIHL